MTQQLRRFIDIAVFADGTVVTPKGTTHVDECSFALIDVEVTGRVSLRTVATVGVVSPTFGHAATSSLPLESTSTKRVPACPGENFAAWAELWVLATKRDKDAQLDLDQWMSPGEAIAQYGAILGDEGLARRCEARFQHQENRKNLIALRIAQRYMTTVADSLNSTLTWEADMLSHQGAPPAVVENRLDLAERLHESLQLRSIFGALL